jgi:hypothetical protein
MLIMGVLILDFMSVFFFVSLYGFMTKFSKRFFMFAQCGKFSAQIWVVYFAKAYQFVQKTDYKLMDKVAVVGYWLVAGTVGWVSLCYLLNNRFNLICRRGRGEHKFIGPFGHGRIENVDVLHNARLEISTFWYLYRKMGGSMFFIIHLSLCTHYNYKFCNEFLLAMNKSPMFPRNVNGFDSKQMPIYEMSSAIAAVFGAMTAGLRKIKFTHN